MSVILVYFLTQKHLWLQKSMLREVRNWIISMGKIYFRQRNLWPEIDTRLTTLKILL